MAIATLRGDVELRSVASLEALDTMPPSESRFDLVLLDLNLPGHSGLESLDALRQRLSDPTVVIFSASNDAQTIGRALRRGARGFIPKTSSHRVLIDALRLVLDGGVYVPPDILAEAMSVSHAPEAVPAPDQSSPNASGRVGAVHVTTFSGSREIDALTERQREVLALLAEGMQTKEICRRLGISPNTAKTHIATIFRAIGVNNRAQLVAAVHRLTTPRAP
jgi:DNA-binding NarL/FixJ family response regulator